MFKNKLSFALIQFVTLFVVLTLIYWIFDDQIQWSIIISISIAVPIFTIFWDWATTPHEKENNKKK
jgi:uncharacterized membrane protein YqjE